MAKPFRSWECHKFYQIYCIRISRESYIKRRKRAKCGVKMPKPSPANAPSIMSEYRLFWTKAKTMQWAKRNSIASWRAAFIHFSTSLYLLSQCESMNFPFEFGSENDPQWLCACERYNVRLVISTEETCKMRIEYWFGRNRLSFQPVNRPMWG